MASAMATIASASDGQSEVVVRLQLEDGAARTAARRRIARHVSLRADPERPWLIHGLFFRVFDCLNRAGGGHRRRRLEGLRGLPQFDTFKQRVSNRHQLAPAPSVVFGTLIRDVAECVHRLRRGWECLPIELKGPFEPAAQTAELLWCFAIWCSKCLVQDVAEVARILVGAQATAEKQRQRDKTELKKVRATVGPSTGRRRLGNAQLQVHARWRQLQPLQSGGKNMLDDDEMSLGCNHDAGGGQRAMADAVAVLVEDRESRGQLLDQGRRKRGTLRVRQCV